MHVLSFRQPTFRGDNITDLDVTEPGETLKISAPVAKKDDTSCLEVVAQSAEAECIYLSLRGLLKLFVDPETSS